MKGIKLFFTVLLALPIMAAGADDTSNSARRTAVRRNSTTTSTTAARAKTPDTPQTVRSRTTTVTPTSGRDASTTKTAPSRENVTARTTQKRETATRDTKNVQNRTDTTSSTRTSVRTAPSRTAIVPTTSAPRTSNPTRAAVSGASRAATRAATRTAATSTARTATRTSVKNAGRMSRAAITAETVMSRDFSKCRTVYYECMDEFCANKDTQLKRCACSARVNEFDGIKQQLAMVEDKLQDFNQRLLTVNMDAEDAAALGTATEGELAFNQKDTSDSKKMLDDISKKLNTAFGDDTLNAGLGAISLSLNMDSAFDSVDSLAGASTTTKTGVALYKAALPVCQEMAAEVCSPDDLAIVTSGYQVTIEQDCNTVSKAYATQSDRAREKIREGGALLDMSRLDIHQKRNSDDMITCKSKMLEMLSDSTVCGDELGKCLDTTGQYIDPSTGEAFLTTSLVNLAKLITRPDTNQSWTTVPGNKVFVQHLESKKKFLEPAMENCQNIADTVWDGFIEDALAQIKLAQDKKLEEVRQSCTTLTAQCLDKSLETLADFDARALSTFGVAADKTANAMCTDVRNACTALLDVIDGGDDWQTGVDSIVSDTTYDTIMKTCREVGRACVIQHCKSISGNFGLCTDINTSTNRRDILNRSACWDEVKSCVAEAGNDAIKNIFTGSETIMADIDITTGKYNYSMYWSTSNKPAEQLHDVCYSVCGGSAKDYTAETLGPYTETPECRTCRLAERIWGNCEFSADTALPNSGDHNEILLPTDGTPTILSWFAQNTGTTDAPDNCRTTMCPRGETAFTNSVTGQITCIASAHINTGSCTAGSECADNEWAMPVSSTWTNCCAGGRDAMGNCCSSNGNGAIKTTIPGLKLIGTNNKGYTTLNADANDSYYTITKNLRGIKYGTNNASTAVAQGLCLKTEQTYEFVALINTAEMTGTDTENNFEPNKEYILLCEGSLNGENNGENNYPTLPPSTTNYANNFNPDQNDGFPSGNVVACAGRYMLVNITDGKYSYVNGDDDEITQNVSYCYRDETTGDTGTSIDTHWTDNGWSYAITGITLPNNVKSLLDNLRPSAPSVITYPTNSN